LQREGEEIKVVMVMERLESNLKAAIDCRKRDGRLRRNWNCCRFARKKSYIGIEIENMSN